MEDRLDQIDVAKQTEAMQSWLYGNNPEVPTQEDMVQAEEPVTDDKEQAVANLISLLESPHSEIGDWKVAKYQEYMLSGMEAPYDIKDLHNKRQAVRDRINQLRSE